MARSIERYLELLLYNSLLLSTVCVLLSAGFDVLKYLNSDICLEVKYLVDYQANC